MEVLECLTKNAIFIKNYNPIITHITNNDVVIRLIHRHSPGFVQHFTLKSSFADEPKG